MAYKSKAYNHIQTVNIDENENFIAFINVLQSLP